MKTLTKKYLAKLKVILDDAQIAIMAGNRPRLDNIREILDK